MSATNGTAALLAWIEVPRERAVAFDAWYSYEHLVERVQVPGFLRGTRYQASAAPDAADLRYFTVYEVDGRATFSSPAYLERLDHPTPWTLATIPSMSLGWRMAADLSATVGAGRSARVLIVELDESAADRTGLERIREALTVLRDEFTVVTARAYTRDTPASSTRDSTTEGRAGGSGTDGAPGAVAIVDLHPGADAGRVARLLGDAAGAITRTTEAALLYDLASAEAAALAPIASARATSP